MNKKMKKFKADHKKRVQEEIINALEVGIFTLRKIKIAITQVLHEDGYLGVGELRED